MINIPKIPKLPSKDELEYKEKTLLIEIAGQLRGTHKFWYLALVAVVVLALPLRALLQSQVAAWIISRHEIIDVAENPERPEDLQIVKTAALPAGPGTYSGYAHVVNANPDWSAWTFDYQMAFRNSAGEVLRTTHGQSFMLPGTSRFVTEPRILVSDPPTAVEFSITNIRWTNRVPSTVPEFAILQKQWGEADGKFFVEGAVKNPYSFLVKKVNVQALVFDSSNKLILAVNQTTADDLKPFEDRYFRMLWPVSQDSLLPALFGQIQVTADVNPLEPGFGLPVGEPLPSR